MKNNHDKLTDAFGMLREDTLDVCVTATAAPRRNRSATARRVAVLLAACLTFAMTAALILILPALRSEEPAPTPPIADPTVTTPLTDTSTEPDVPTLPDTELPTTPGFNLSFYNAPLVNVQVLSSIMEKEMEENVSMSFGEGLFSNEVYILFTVEEGETVTVKSHNGKIASANLWDSGIVHDSWKEKFQFDAAKGSINTHFESFGYEVTISSNEVFIQWGGGNRYWEESIIGGTPDEDYADFIVRNADGHITGAGSVYLANRKPLENTASRYYDEVSISRGLVLGSVRFENPAEVTEEQVADYLESLHEDADDVRETIFDNPTLFDLLKCAMGDMINTRYADFNTFGSIHGFAGGDRYIVINVFNDDIPDFKSGEFLLMEDGSWGEIQYSGNFCEYCSSFPANEGKYFTSTCEHWKFTHERFVLTNGRILDEHTEYVRDEGALLVGTTQHLVEVTPDTYTTPTPHDVIQDLLNSKAPMLDAVTAVFSQIDEELGGSTQIVNAYQPFRHITMQDVLYAHFSTLSLLDAEGNSHDYLVLEDGQYAEYSKIRYTSSISAYYSIDKDLLHDGAHDNGTVTFTLVNGGTYSVRINWVDLQVYEPVYNP